MNCVICDAPQKSNDGGRDTFDDNSYDTKNGRVCGAHTVAEIVAHPNLRIWLVYLEPGANGR